MLVLSRKTGESIIISDNIELSVLDCRNGEVKLGIKAPREVLILRKEIQDAVRGENIKAAQTAKSKDVDKLIGPLVEQLKKKRKK
ncbi:MAG: carbon storage regulator CsrA [Planctomycetes bacterium]|nr:carbon storage regulator CsrA [Planctomycetota bacterium]